MSTTRRHATRGWSRYRAALGLMSLVGAIGMVRCISFTTSCEPGDCPAGHSCGRGGGCELMEGSCATDADCPEGQFCVGYSRQGLSGPSYDTTCVSAPGEVGAPCGSTNDDCVIRASCLRPTRIELANDVGVGEGDTYWLETLAVFRYSTVSADSICINRNSLGVGEVCSDTMNCAADLVCHMGYTPRQCRPRSVLGEPCGAPNDCAEGNCLMPEVEAPYELTTDNCAVADPRCDVRVDASCGYWLSCAECTAPGG